VMVHHYQGCTQCNNAGPDAAALPGGAGQGLRQQRAWRPREYLKVPANTLVPLPDELSFSAGAAIACGSGTAYSALRRIAFRQRHAGDFRQGPVGLAATQYAKAMGRR